MENINLSLGSNVGDKILNLTSAITLLNERFEIVAVSGVYQTEPADYTAQDDFFNLALLGKTTLSAEECLAFIKEIECKMGREKTHRFGPRNIDIDIIYFGNKVVSTPYLTIPHPRMHERLFVLKPLSTLPNVPDHPIQKRSIRQLIELAPQMRVIPIEFS